MHHPTDRIAHTTAFVTPVVEHWLEREIAQWVHPMKDQSDDPSHHERTLLPRSYISLLLKSRILNIFIIAIHIALILNLSPNSFFSVYHLTTDLFFVLGVITHSIGHSFVLTVWWVVKLILRGGPIELIFVPASAPWLVITKIVLGTILSGMVYIKCVPM